MGERAAIAAFSVVFYGLIVAGFVLLTRGAIADPIALVKGLIGSVATIISLMLFVSIAASLANLRPREEGEMSNTGVDAILFKAAQKLKLELPADLNVVIYATRDVPHISISEKEPFRFGLRLIAKIYYRPDEGFEVEFMDPIEAIAKAVSALEV